MAKVGRPSKYQKKYCDLVIEIMREGKSLVAVAAEIGVSRKILNDWQVRYPDFREACDVGKALSQAWWEKLATMVAVGAHHNTRYAKANYGMIQFLISRRFPDYYAKSPTLEMHNHLPEQLDDRDDNNVVTINVESLSTDQLLLLEGIGV